MSFLSKLGWKGVKPVLVSAPEIPEVVHDPIWDKHYHRARQGVGRLACNYCSAWMVEHEDYLIDHLFTRHPEVWDGNGTHRGVKWTVLSG